ncbi:butyrophilin subfamily 2 member A2-like [Polymixia lowei]
MKLCLVAALCASLSIATSGITVSVPRAPVSTRLGSTATLPCSLNPPENAELLEVRWYRGDQFDAPVLSYRERQFEYGSQQAEYVGRTSFGLISAKSDGLKAGDVTLNLANVRLQDTGEYTCYVSSDTGFDKAVVSLIVTQKGTSPLLSVAWTEDLLVNMSCESEGWHPNPRLRWSDQTKTLAPKSLVYSNDTSGLVSVQSWLLLSSTSTVTCFVGLSGEEDWEGRLSLESLVQPPEQGKSQESGSSVVGWVAFTVVSIALAVVLLLYFKNKKGKRSKPDPEKGGDNGEETQMLLSTDELLEITALEEARKHYVNVTLDETENEYLKTKDGKIVREGDRFPDGKKVTRLTSIQGTPGFSSGQHYWEVRLGDEKAGIKKSWWVGVASATGKQQQPEVPPTPSNGFWFLSSVSADSLQVNTEPSTVLLNVRPEILGVYLNYDRGELSFYDVKDQRPIVTLAAKFTEEVFPFFNPGKGDKATIRILNSDNSIGSASSNSR